MRRPAGPCSRWDANRSDQAGSWPYFLTRCSLPGPAGRSLSGQAGGDLLQRKLQPQGQTALPGPPAVQPDAAPRGQELHHGPQQVN